MKKNIIIISLLAIAVVAVIATKKKNQDGTANSCSSCGTCSLTAEHNPSELTDTKNTKTNQPLPMLLDLGASKCVPCKMMAPILDEMKETFTGQLDVTFIDVWEDQSAGQKYGIRMIPTQIFFDANGKELFRHEGFYSREDIMAKWQELGIELKEKAQDKED